MIELKDKSRYGAEGTRFVVCCWYSLVLLSRGGSCFSRVEYHCLDSAAKKNSKKSTQKNYDSIS